MSFCVTLSDMRAVERSCIGVSQREYKGSSMDRFSLRGTWGGAGPSSSRRIRRCCLSLGDWGIVNQDRGTRGTHQDIHMLHEEGVGIVQLVEGDVDLEVLLR